ncbi:MAG: hypothetical protein HFH93_01900 [Lachnospiraceae bacterium]|nr:hypothetical protein [Lachnospiraceae bacterium]
MKETTLWKSVVLPVGLCIKDGMIWFIQNGGNQIMGMDMHSFQIRKHIRIPCMPWGNSFFHRKLNDKIVDIGNRMLILLNGSKTIYAYNFSSGEIDVLTCLPNGKTFRNNSILYQNRTLYLLPYQSNYLLKYDIDNDDWEEIQITDHNICFEKCFEIDNDIILAVDSNSNRVYQYNICKNIIEISLVGDKNNHYWGITKAQGYYVMPHSDKCAVTLWKKEAGETYEIADFPDSFRSVKGYAYLNMYKTENDVLLIPYYANIILKIDVRSKSISNIFPQNCFWLNDCPNRIDDEKMAYYSSTMYNKRLYLYSVTRQNWHVLDTITMDMGPFNQCKMEEEDNECIGMLFDDNSKQFFLGYESSFTCCNLKNLILSIRKSIESCRKTESYYGADIWNYLKDKI